MTLKASSSGAFVRGVDSSTGMLLQPKGSVPRASNLILTKRGSLQTCDGSSIVQAFGTGPVAGRGRSLCDFFYQPTPGSGYFMRLMVALDQHLGAPQHLSVVDGGTGGTFTAGTYYWEVTAYDGSNETIASNEASAAIAANHVATLTWNIVPNAVGYRLFRSTSSGAEKLVSGIPGFYIPQPALGNLTVSFTDTGYSTSLVIAPPISDLTAQTALFQTNVTGQYNNSNIVALFPAPYYSTPSGGIVGSLGPLPQMVQFVDEVIMALGNGYAPQIFNGFGYKNASTISSISVDAYGVVSITTSGAHGLYVGSCCLISGTGNSLYNGAFQVISVGSSTTFKVRNLPAIGQGAAAQGTVTPTTNPIQSTFQAQFPAWVAKGSYALNSIIEPTTSPTSYFQAIAPADGGVSGATEPTWPQTGGSDGTGLGLTVQDGNITWRNAGTIASASPPPPGAAHIAVYAGALWVWDTYVSNTTNGLDGPCCLRMSDVNNPNSWNPVNTAFLDKDDGSEGMGLATFTITAQGIPPQGSLVASKQLALYQIAGVFGSSNFLIQRIITNMGTIAPRTLQFVPGYGIGRLTHMGIAVFDGVSDRLISPQVAPYLFAQNDAELSDITPADINYLFLCYAFQTSVPAMYCVATPPTGSGGQLSQILCFDLVLKAWSVVQLPFNISVATQAGYTYTSNSNQSQYSYLASYSDGTLQRWQSGSNQWATSVSGSNVPAPVAWSVRTPPTASKDPEERLYCRRAVVVGQSGSGIVSPITIQPRINGVAKTAQKASVPTSGRFAVQASVNATSDLFDAIVSGSGDITIDGVSFDVTPKPLGAIVGLIG